MLQRLSSVSDNKQLKSYQINGDITLCTKRFDNCYSRVIEYICVLYNY